MRLTILLITLIASTYSFHPVPRLVRPKTELGIERRDVVITGIAALIAAPRLAQAKGSSTWFYDEKIETVKEASQMPTDGRLDVNAAFVGDYKILPGFFPTTAGKIASHGPYRTVKDLYSIPDLSEHDKSMIRKYEAYLTANPPGRNFGERINARVST